MLFLLHYEFVKVSRTSPGACQVMFAFVPGPPWTFVLLLVLSLALSYHWLIILLGLFTYFVVHLV